MDSERCPICGEARAKCRERLGLNKRLRSFAPAPVAVTAAPEPEPTPAPAPAPALPIVLPNETQGRLF